MNRRNIRATSTPAISQTPTSGPTAAQTEISSVVTSGSARPPRPDSKFGIVLSLLQADQGASLAKLVEVTNWQPHTMRAALTGLRKRGYLITSDKIVGADGAKHTVYRIAMGQAQ